MIWYAENTDKKAKSDNGNDNVINGKVDRENIAVEFEKFWKEISNHLSTEQMRKILKANGRGWTCSDDAVVPRWSVQFFLKKIEIISNVAKRLVY